MTAIEDSAAIIQKNKWKDSETVPDKLSPESRMPNPELSESTDYTRYGDWQIKGKCVDF